MNIYYTNVVYIRHNKREFSALWRISVYLFVKIYDFPFSWVSSELVCSKIFHLFYQWTSFDIIDIFSVKHLRYYDTNELNIFSRLFNRRKKIKFHSRENSSKSKVMKNHKTKIIFRPLPIAIFTCTHTLFRGKRNEIENIFVRVQLVKHNSISENPQ